MNRGEQSRASKSDKPAYLAAEAAITPAKIEAFAKAAHHRQAVWRLAAMGFCRREDELSGIHWHYDEGRELLIVEFERMPRAKILF